VNQIVWLASYPKSGNTWLRVFLTNFVRNDGPPADINALEMQANAASRHVVDHALVVECSDLTEDELAWYRPEAYRILAGRSHQTLYLKIHDAYTRSADGEPLIPADVTRGAVYLVRNPLDVAASLAHHHATTLDRTIELMGSEDGALVSGQTRLAAQLKQRLLTWSQHVLTWVDQTAIPVHLMRYEDMLGQPVETFSAALRFLGLPDDADRVRMAVGFSSFQHLRDQEQAHGFTEKPHKAESFFRLGRAGSWRESLTEAQIGKIIEDHGAVMRRLGYLTQDGQPREEMVHRNEAE
jgi:sulfotransferase family protein